MSDGALLTNEARVLLCVADDRNVRMRDIAACVGVTERAAYDLLCELIERGYLSREKVGRRNRYRLHLEAVEGDSDEREQLQRLSALLGRPARTSRDSAKVDGGVGRHAIRARRSARPR